MQELSILLLAADSGEGNLGEMLDPRLRAQFAAEGIHCQACYISDLKREHLDHFHCVVLLRTPVPQHPFGDETLFRDKSAWLRDFVEQGGGLFLMFTECYGKTESTLNELCAPWGIRFAFNRLTPDATVPVTRFPRLYESSLLPIQMVSSTALVFPFQTMRIVTEAGHGTQHLTCMPESGSPWQPVCRGGPHITSEGYGTYYINSSQDPIPDPVLGAARAWGRGRILAFPGSAPFWLVNSHIWRFQGLLQEQDGKRGFQFFCSAWRWLADTGRVLPTTVVEQASRVIDRAWLRKPGQCSFRPVDPDHQASLLRANPEKIWIGAHALDTGSLKTLATRVASTGTKTAFPLGRYEELDETRWNQLLADCRSLSTPELAVHPGYELLDGEGVASAVVSPATFPRHTLHYPNSTLLENVWIAIFGCLSILRKPLANRLPPQRYGGYNLIEWDPSEAWFTLYKRLVASKYFIGPIAFNPLAEHGASTWVLVPEGRNAYDMLRTNMHATFISDGPVLERFAWTRPGLIEDEWEGYWWGYKPGDTAEVALSIRSESPLAEVVLYDGEEELARFTPDTPLFSRRLELKVWRDLCLHATARDRAGRCLFATFPLYTRNLGFWGHVGSDQMNNYVNAMTPTVDGYLGVGGKQYDMFGFVTLGAAWGDYLRITPSLSYAEFMPRQEVSGIIGSFNVHHPSALLSGDAGQRYYLNDHRRVFPFCGADAQVFRGEVAGEHRDNEDGRQETWHGTTITPTRILSPVPEAHATDEYVVWRWSVNHPVCVEVRKHFRLAPRYLEDPWFTFASNSHWNIPGLSIRAMRTPARAVAVADLPPATLAIPPGKEWDNSHYLRMTGHPPSAEFSTGTGGEIEIGTGGAGTFGLIPLGPSRDLRTRIWVTPKEVQVFFQCRLLPSEQQGGRFTISYLVAVDATESASSPFGDLLKTVDAASTQAGTGRRFSRSLDLNGLHFPATVDLGRIFPEANGAPLYLEVNGLPSGTIEWHAPDGSLAFASQPQAGRSWHILPAGMARIFRLAATPRWKELAP